jgi:lipopolysaccharide O-acetyltransferase
MSFLSPLRRLLYGPLRGMKAGSNVYLERPHRISHPESIRVGDRTRILRNALIEPIHQYAGVNYSPQVEIGSDVYIGPNLFLACIGRVSIGDGSVLSEGVFINDNNHGFDPQAGLIMKQPLVHGGDVAIGKHCFVGLRSAIMPGVTLGDHCIVAINSVVTKSFPACSMVGGAPAKLIRSYDPATKSWATK